MPYIAKANRAWFDSHLIELAYMVACSGELNYCITKLLHLYAGKNDESYTLLNELIGVLECAKLELYRRKLAPYEDKKIEQNGDV